MIPHHEIDIFIDEAKLNEDKNAATVTSILGRIHSIRPSASSEIGTEILLATSVFVLGFYVEGGNPIIFQAFFVNLYLNFAVCRPPIVTLNVIMALVLQLHSAV